MKERLKDVRHALTSSRETSKLIKRIEDKHGERSYAIPAQDIEIMFVGKLVNELIKQSVASQNMLAAYIRDYGEVYPEVAEKLTEYQHQFAEDFAQTKKRLIKITKSHPLAKRVCEIKGFTPYNLALVMSFIKDVGRFSTPSKLMVYAGVGVKYGRKISKRNINEIRKLKHQEYDGRAEDFTEFGYNTALQGRLYEIGNCLLRAKGYFFNMYSKMRPRLEQRAINNGECFIATAEDQKQSKGKMKAGKYYMEGRKNQSLISWSDSNARARIQRTLLHLIYKEWRELNGLECRNPYPIDYLGHSNYITLEDVLNYESKK